MNPINSFEGSARLIADQAAGRANPRIVTGPAVEPIMSAAGKLLETTNEALSLAETISDRLLGSIPTAVLDQRAMPDKGNVRRSIDQAAERLERLVQALTRINNSI